ncbi:hypothetical protein D3C76_1579240 [compost metagenome]
MIHGSGVIIEFADQHEQRGPDADLHKVADQHQQHRGRQQDHVHPLRDPSGMGFTDSHVLAQADGHENALQQQAEQHHGYTGQQIVQHDKFLSGRV